MLGISTKNMLEVSKCWR